MTRADQDAQVAKQAREQLAYNAAKEAERKAEDIRLANQTLQSDPPPRKRKPK